MTKEQLLFLKSLTNTIEENISEYDTDAILKMAVHQSVLPLVFEHLSNAPDFDCEKYAKYQKRAIGNVMAQAARSMHFKKIYKCLTDAEIKPVVIKGIILRNLYGEECNHRPSGDEDVIIRREDFRKTHEVLTENGFLSDMNNITERILDEIQEITYYNESCKLKLEVHLNPLGKENKLTRLLSETFDSYYENIIKVNVDGCEFFTLDYTEGFIYLFFHFVRHIAKGVGIRQMLDMYKFLDAYSAFIDMERIKKTIEGVKFEKLYADLIDIGNRYFGYSFDTCFETVNSERLLESAFTMGTFGNDTKELAGSEVIIYSAMRNGEKANALSMLFPPLSEMKNGFKILYKHPYLLPFVWLWRIIRYTYRILTGKKSKLSESERIADDRIALLRDYDII